MALLHGIDGPSLHSTLNYSTCLRHHASSFSSRIPFNPPHPFNVTPTSQCFNERLACSSPAIRCGKYRLLPTTGSCWKRRSTRSSCPRPKRKGSLMRRDHVTKRLPFLASSFANLWFSSLIGSHKLTNIQRRGR